MRRRPLLVAIMQVTVIACSQRERCDPLNFGEVECLLIDEIQTQLERSDIREPVIPSLVDFDTLASAAVPDLSYVIAQYEPPNTSDILASAYGIVGRSSPRVFHDWGDWVAAVQPWTPTSESDAINACIEIVTLTGNPHPRRPRIVFQPGMDLTNVHQFPFVYVDDKEVLEHMAGPIAESGPAGLWLVEVWVVSIESTSRVRCEFGHSDSRISELFTTRSVGLMRYGP